MEALFKYFDQFQSVSAVSKLAISNITEAKVIKKNYDLQSIGHTCQTIYFLKKGVARIYYFKEEVDITESFSFENNLVVRYESLFSNSPSKKGIQMLEDSEILAINAKELFKLFNKHPDIERLFRKIIEGALVDQVNRIESLQFHSAEERYKALLKESPGVLQRVALKYIASYLGITPVSLSRIRAQL